MTSTIVRSQNERIIYYPEGGSSFEIRMPAHGWVSAEPEDISPAFLKLTADLEPVIRAYMAWKK